jgi:hypothetical protein
MAVGRGVVRMGAMRWLLVLALAGCASEPTEPVCRGSVGNVIECDRATWQVPEGETWFCEEPCANPGAASGPPCLACRGFGGEEQCENTIAYDDRVGCCVQNGDKVRFFTCY